MKFYTSNPKRFERVLMFEKSDDILNNLFGFDFSNKEFCIVCKIDLISENIMIYYQDQGEFLP